MAGFSAGRNVTSERVKSQQLLPRDALRASVSIPLVFLFGLAFGAFFGRSLDKSTPIALNVAVLAVVLAWMVRVLVRPSFEASPQLLTGVFLLALGSTLGFVSGVELAVAECLIKTAGVVLVGLGVDRKARARGVEGVRRLVRCVSS